MRIDALRAKLAEKKLSGLVVTDKTNRRYLCGFTGSNGLLLVTEINQLCLWTVVIQNKRLNKQLVWKFVRSRSKSFDRSNATIYCRNEGRF